ncbi:hypothetical protein HBH60_043320 [Parastagonospora nodorum]|nr:hypothetical protein HBI00_003230 [Parastagonospora nodorum]KAH4730508.1 hypothetical protein HBH66_051740 [Parastagonospora nodorum]KAH4833789.1 hypothetical protein HBH60_043320 [Parastagonospora nodorum]KAH5114639.1 hypothetical protein HBH71_143400 [Parastagonospora nodorum]
MTNAEETSSKQAHHNSVSTSRPTTAKHDEQAELCKTAKEAYARNRHLPFPVTHDHSRPSTDPVTHVPSNFAWKWNTVEIRSEIWAGWQWDVVGREENDYLDVIERVGKVKTAVEAAEAEEAEVPRAAENHHGAFHMREPGVEAYDTPPQTGKSPTPKRKHVEPSPSTSSHVADIVSLDVYYPKLPQLDPSSGASFLTIPDEEVPELADANTEDEGITEVVEPSFSTAAQDEETVRVEDDAGDKSIQNPPPGAALTSSESASGSRRR